MQNHVFRNSLNYITYLFRKYNDIYQTQKAVLKKLNFNQIILL